MLKKSCFVFFILSLIGLFCREVSIASSTAEEQIKAVLAMQAAAWNRGDLDEFMTGYLQSANTSYTSGGVEVWGYDALRQRYQSKYGASKDTMGKLNFSDLKVFTLSPASALCIGHWHLERHDLPELNGIFSLVLVREKSAWKIMHDHTSTIDKPTAEPRKPGT